jgi:hypothetical protein
MRGTNAPGKDPAGPKPRDAPTRRRLLHTAGGWTLLAGGAVASGLALEDAFTALRRLVAPPNSSTKAPPVPARTAPVYRLEDDDPWAIALTMDDGPHPVYTPQVLDLLEGYGITATFNMIGCQVADNLSLVREVSAAGHVITNHTWPGSTRASFARPTATGPRPSTAHAPPTG